MKVLIAEDSPSPRKMLERALKRLGHECIVAEDGAEAWELFERHGADVVISDWMMPKLHGDELCRLIRSGAESPYTYFIIVTTLDDHAFVIGAMEAGADDFLNKPFALEELEARLIAAARVTALHGRLHAHQAEVEELNRRLFEESRHDPLTRLGNRIALREQMGELSARADRYQQTYAVVLLDIDGFKSYNDACGHVAGDAVLTTVADTVAGVCRREDAAYRYGGEELLVVLPEQGLEEAAVAAERLRRRVAELAIPHPGRGPGAVVTVSAGVARLEPSDAGDFEAIVMRADAALYRAKELGRDRVELGLLRHAA